MSSGNKAGDRAIVVALAGGGIGGIAAPTGGAYPAHANGLYGEYWREQR